MTLLGLANLLFFGAFGFLFLREVNYANKGWNTAFDYLFKMCIGAFVLAFALLFLTSAGVIMIK